MIFNLLNYVQDLPHIPFRARRRHHHEEESLEPIEVQPVAVPRKDLIESGKLTLREEEFGQYPLEHHVEKSTVTIEYRQHPVAYSPEYALDLLEPQAELSHSYFVPEVVETGQLLLREDDLHSLGKNLLLIKLSQLIGVSF